jgi:sigma-B regulation protein RsbU (phosphoserine phosphatase)
LTAIVKAAFRSAAADRFAPERVIRRLHEAVVPFGDDRFVTGICGCLDPASRRLEYINAGHPPGVVWSPRAAPVSIPSTGPIVCSAFDDKAWEVGRLTLPPGFVALLFTDGLADGLGLSLGKAGPDLAAHITDPGDDGIADQILERVFSTLGGRPAWDDITLLAIREAP